MVGLPWATHSLCYKSKTFNLPCQEDFLAPNFAGKGLGEQVGCCIARPKKALGSLALVFNGEGKCLYFAKWRKKTLIGKKEVYKKRAAWSGPARGESRGRKSVGVLGIQMDQDVLLHIATLDKKCHRFACGFHGATELLRRGDFLIANSQDDIALTNPGLRG
jgi:hypothetical protein